MIGTDGGGVYGSIFYYSMTIAYVGSAFFIFIYLYKTGKLNMDESPKNQMMHPEKEDINDLKGDLKIDLKRSFNDE